MIGYERTYATGRTISSILEVFGWGLVILGVLVGIVGFASGGLLGTAQRQFGGGDPPLLLSLLGLIPGLLMVWSGLISVMFTQMGRASLDNAEMQREILLLARASSGNVGQGVPSDIASPSHETEDDLGSFIKADDLGDPIKIHYLNVLDCDVAHIVPKIKNTEIHEFPDSFMVQTPGGYRSFPSLEAAEEFIRNGA